MTNKFFNSLLTLIFLASFNNVFSQSIPEMFWYRFEETGSNQTPNLAVPGVGSASATVNGGLSMGSTGQFGATLVGSGGLSTTDYVGTGWTTNFGTGNWTISMWLNNFPAGTALNYLFGDVTAGSFRCFYSGAAGQFGVLFRLAGVGGTDFTVPTVGPGPTVLTYVYDSSVPIVHAYKNGVLALSTPQAGPLNIVGTAELKVAGYTTLAGMPAGALLDEFRVYNRALDAAEVAATWNDPLPVELTSLSASVFMNDVVLNWSTASEINNSGFSVERKSADEFETVGFVPGFGTTTEPKSYSFTDANLQPGIYSYRLKQTDFDGTFEYSEIVEAEVIAPAEYSLQQNYPNPFNPSTTISFSLALDSKISLKIFNVLGQEIVQLLNSDLPAGSHEIKFDAGNLNSGVYFYKLVATGTDETEFTDIKKMTLTK